MTSDGSFEDLRQEVINCLEKHPDEELLVAALQRIIDDKGPFVCQVILHVLTSLNLKEKEATRCWSDIVKHRRTMQAAFRRDVSLRTAICDYFTTVRKSLKNPMVVELQVFEKTLKSSHEDGLTKLFNRAYFDTAFDRELSIAKRHDTDVSLLFFDIDDFKQINDTCGHLTGDKALIQLAEIIVSEKRTGDIACRYGGEEMLIILPYTNNVDALVLGERIRKRVEKTPLKYNRKKLHFTVSGGLVSFPGDASDAVSLLKYADTAMYRAKGSGKNNISFFSKDKRRYLRIDYRLPLQIKELDFDAGATETGIGKNICLGGLLFETDRPRKIGTRLQLCLPINEELLLLIGTVVRVEAFTKGRYDIGLALSFQEMEKLARKEISRYLSKHEEESKK